MALDLRKLNGEHKQSRSSKSDVKLKEKMTMSDIIREFLVDVAENHIMQGKSYSLRIPIDDGGSNSYIGFDLDLDDWKSKGKIQQLSLFRHTNSVDKLTNTWKFELGGICNEYHANPDIPLRFSSYGKTPDQAKNEAQSYFKELRRLIKRRTSEYKIEAAKTAKEEKEELLARLAELEDNPT